MNAPQLEVLLQAGHFHAQDLENWLTENKVFNYLIRRVNVLICRLQHHHALGLLYKHIQMHRKALKVWERYVITR